MTHYKGVFMISQRQATVSVILSVLSERGVNYTLNGEQSIADVLTVTDKEQVVNKLVAGFRSGQVQMSSEASDKYAYDTELKKYVVGLVNNWIRKAPEFNGGNAYATKNPGSRTGSGDEKLKALRALMSKIDDATTKATIQLEIDKRLEELKPKIEIDAALIPESLRHLL
jgi:hypothetical protein